MKNSQLSLFLFIISVLFSCNSPGKKKPEHEQQNKEQRYVFFLHGRFVEIFGDSDTAHPEYGRCEYWGIVDVFNDSGFTVISEVRPENTDGVEYSKKVAGQVDSLLNMGVKPSQITVIGTSKGGYIARLVSNRLKNKDINYMFIGCCLEWDETDSLLKEPYGNILSIYEETDSLGQSCRYFAKSAGVNRFREVELNTRTKHGFLYKPLDAWTSLAMQWAKGNYELKEAANDEFTQIDSLLAALQFNGIISINRNGKTVYSKTAGYSDLEQKTSLVLSDRFVIGSVSKQITAAIVLREYEKGKIKLHESIKTYLPELTQKWAEKVTVHHLLTHTHGIPEMLPTEFSLNKISDKLAFEPGAGYSYSQIGFHLLALIAEKASGKGFPQLSAELFKDCRMNNTFHPALFDGKNLVKGYVEIENKVVPQTRNQNHAYDAAGGFISTIYDVQQWNVLLHTGKLLNDSTYKLMITKHPNAVRAHPTFGRTEYGYGITVLKNDTVFRVGQTGYVPGFASMCFYYPETNTSVVGLSNVAYGNGDISKAFNYVVKVLKIMEMETDYRF